MNIGDYSKILVIGSPGSGKSRFSRLLGEKTGLPIIHLDKEYWHPGWVGTPKPEWREKVIGFISEDRWIIDGDYSGTLDLRMEACDLIFYFDLPRITCLRGVLERFGKPRPDMADGNEEKFDREFFSFLIYVWNFPKKHKTLFHECFEKYGDKKIITFKTRRDADRFLEEVTYKKDF